MHRRRRLSRGAHVRRGRVPGPAAGVHHRRRLSCGARVRRGRVRARAAGVHNGRRLPGRLGVHRLGVRSAPDLSFQVPRRTHADALTSGRGPGVGICRG